MVKEGLDLSLILAVRSYLKRVSLVLLAASMLHFGAGKYAATSASHFSKRPHSQSYWRGHKDQRASWSRHNDPMLKLPELGRREEFQWPDS